MRGNPHAAYDVAEVGDGIKDSRQNRSLILKCGDTVSSTPHGTYRVRYRFSPAGPPSPLDPSRIASLVQLNACISRPPFVVVLPIKFTTASRLDQRACQPAVLGNGSTNIRCSILNHLLVPGAKWHTGYRQGRPQLSIDGKPLQLQLPQAVVVAAGSWSRHRPP